VPPPIPTLQSGFWQTLLYGSPDALVGSSDATNALRLVAKGIGFAIEAGETIPAIRAGQLRKLLRERFDPARAEQAMAALWRAALASPGAPQPSEDQGQLLAESLSVGRNQPQWIRELNEPGGAQREWLIENGLWCG
jgi:hypothetical protein